MFNKNSQYTRFLIMSTLKKSINNNRKLVNQFYTCKKIENRGKELDLICPILICINAHGISWEEMFLEIGNNVYESEL